MSWTTEQVAEHLNITVEEVYASRRRGDFPGKLGQRRGKRLVFNPDQITDPPADLDKTDDVMVAVLWELQAQTRMLRQIIAELRVDKTPIPHCTINLGGKPCAFCEGTATAEHLEDENE